MENISAREMFASTQLAKIGRQEEMCSFLQDLDYQETQAIATLDKPKAEQRSQEDINAKTALGILVGVLSGFAARVFSNISDRSVLNLMAATATSLGLASRVIPDQSEKILQQGDRALNGDRCNRLRQKVEMINAEINRQEAYSETHTQLTRVKSAFMGAISEHERKISIDSSVRVYR